MLFIAVHCQNWTSGTSQEKNLSPRLVKLRFDFFEAKRRDLHLGCGEWSWMWRAGDGFSMGFSMGIHGNIIGFSEDIWYFCGTMWFLRDFCSAEFRGIFLLHKQYHINGLLNPPMFVGSTVGSSLEKKIEYIYICVCVEITTVDLTKWESTVLDLSRIFLWIFMAFQKTARKEKHGTTDHVEVIRRWFLQMPTCFIPIRPPGVYRLNPHVDLQ